MSFWDDPVGGGQRPQRRSRGRGLGAIVVLLIAIIGGSAAITAGLLSQPAPITAVPTVPPTVPPLLTPLPTIAAALIPTATAVPAATRLPTTPPDPVQSALLTAINAVRTADGLPPLIADARLNAYAADQVRGIDQAISGYGYYPRSGTTITFTEVTDPAQLAPFWAGEYRAVITAGEWNALGAAQHNDAVLIYLAEAFTFTAPGAAETGAGDPAADAQAALIADLLNAARSAAGLGTLTIDAVLTRAAQVQADDMARGQFLAHTGTDGSSPQERARRAGYASGMVGENVLVQPYVHAGMAFDGWWNSPPHYENMLLPGYTRLGLAYAVAADGQVYYAMVLGG